MNKKIRLQRYLSMCGVASRRNSEKLISDGLVKVNGITVNKVGTCVDLNDVVEYSGKIVRFEEKVYIVMNKPSGVICSKNDRFNRKSVYDFLNTNLKIDTVGRLDYLSEGLIILTNDGDFTFKVCHPSFGITKEYFVESDKEIPEDLIINFTSGIYINGVFYKASKIERIDERTLKVLLTDGKKREIREVYKKYNIKIIRLIRKKIGNLSLENLNLKSGKFKYFSKDRLLGYING